MTFPRAALISLAFALISATPASAQTAIFTDDAEAEPTAKWVVGTPPDGVEPWQKSDSGTTKFRSNQAHGGSTSYWTGIQPTNWPLVPTTAGPGTVIEGESTLTIKESFIVPANGDTNVKYWSLFQNEGDDSGALEVAVDTGAAKLTWKKIKSETAVNTAAGDTDPRACDPSQPGTQSVPFEEQTGSLAAYKGAKVLIRFNLIYGAENRPLSQPCGWYLDDIRVLTTGTPGAAGPPSPGGTPPPAAAKPVVKFGKLKAKGKKATLAVKVSDAAISGAAVTLLKGSKKVGSGKASLLAVGSHSVKLKLSKKLKKGSYKIKLTGKAPDGSAFSAAGKAKV